MADTFELFNGKLHWEEHKVKAVGHRKNHTANLVGGRVYLCGGYDLRGNSNLNDVTVVEATKQKNWYKKKGLKVYEVRLSDRLRPGARNGHTANVVNDQLFVFGGYRLTRALTDVWVFDLVLNSWSELETSGDRHPMLNMHVSEHIDWMNCILCFGGGDGQIFENSVTCLYLGNMEWKKLQPKGNPPPKLANIGGCLVDSTYYIFGGWNPAGKFDDLHLLHLPKDFRKPSWSTPDLADKPLKRVGAGMANFYGRVLMFGGKSFGYCSGLEFYDVQEQRWIAGRDTSITNLLTDFEIKVTGSWPPVRMGHTLTVMPDGAVLVAGGGGLAEHNMNGIPGCLHTLRLRQT